MKQIISSLFLAGLLISPSLSWAAQDKPLAPIQEIQSEIAQLQSLSKANKIAEAVQIMQKRTVSPSFDSLDQSMRIEYYFGLASATSILGRSGEAIAYLGMAVGEGFKDYARLKSTKELDPISKEVGFIVLLETVRFRGDYLQILVRRGDYASNAQKDLVTFKYQSKQDPDLMRFRELWKLESIAGKGSDTSRVLNLLHWVHTQVRHDGNSINPKPMNALNLLDVCRKEGRGINCRGMATILNEACLALGYHSRHITCLPLDEKDVDCHVITSVWLEGLQKWVYLDPTLDAYFTDPQGTLLSIPEVRTRMIKGEPLVLSKEANWNGQKKDPAEYLNYMAKNFMKLKCPQESSFGYESGNGEKAYMELDPVSISPKNEKGVTYIHDPVTFWARP